jgi:hypothetical protein
LLTWRVRSSVRAAVDITGDEMGKSHARHLAGGRPGQIKGERTIRFEFPETTGGLQEFLASLRTDWFLTMLHYRNHGGQVRTHCSHSPRTPTASVHSSH